MEPVRTHRATTVVEAARLHRARDRRERGLTLVEGPELLADVIAAGGVAREVFALRPGPGEIGVDEQALRRLAGTKTPRGPVAVVEIPEEGLDPSRNLLVAVGVSDPGNVGTMIRTAAAFGWGFAYTEGTADPWSPKTIRSGGAGQFQTPVSRVDGVEALGEWVTVATVVRGGTAPEDVPARPVAVVIGEEAHGLPEDLAAACDFQVTIETPGPTESLNAAVAAGIVVYAFSRGSGEASDPV